MPALRLPSSPEPRAKSLGVSAAQVEKTARGGESPRGLSLVRKEPRDRFAQLFNDACKESGTTDASIATAIGNASDKAGSEVRSGKTVLTAGEVAVLLPIEPAAIAEAELWKERYAREAVTDKDPLRRQLLDLLLRRRAEERELLTALVQTKTRR
jgi:hypothetical protein